MPIKNLSLGQKIKRYRLVNDIRQEDMAEKMGISRATLINYEKGYTTINMDVLNRLKNHYQDFAFDEKEPAKPRIIVDNVINFKVLVDVLYKNIKYLILLTFSFAFLGTASSFFLQKYYDAEISLYPAKNDMMQGMSQFQSLAANLGINKMNNDQNFNIPDVVKSRLIANKAINQKWVGKDDKETNLISLWELNRKPWLNILNASKIDSLFLYEKAIRKFNRHVQVVEDRSTGLIKIITSFQDPVISADIANFIGSEVELYIQKENSAQSNKEKLFISERLSIVKKELEKSELELKDFKERNRGFEDSPELFMIYSQLFREVEAKKEVYLTLQQQLELARIQEVKRSPILHILDHAVPLIRKSSPNRLLFLLSSTIFGILFSSSLTLFRY